MIFRLQSTVEELSDTENGELEDVFAQLIESDRSGRHFFISRRELCKWAVENLHLSQRDKTYLTSIHEKYAVRGDMLRVARVYVNVVLGDGSVSFDGKKTFVIGHRALLNGQYLSTCTSFVVEDSDSDIQLYKQILCETKKLSHVPSYEFDPIHGGGSSIASIFEQEIDKQRVVVCVVDHDSLAPNGKKSATANKVISIYRKRNCGNISGQSCFIGIGITTVGRELENYIPYHLFKEMAAYHGYRHFDRLDGLISQNEQIPPEECLWLYFDIKEGICGRKLKELSDKNKISDESISWICKKIGCELQEIEQIKVDGFGKGVITSFFDSHEALSRFHHFVRSEYWLFAFHDYFDKILWFFAAPKPNRL